MKGRIIRSRKLTEWKLVGEYGNSAGDALAKNEGPWLGKPFNNTCNALLTPNGSGNRYFGSENSLIETKKPIQLHQPPSNDPSALSC